jgi:hypothetical protein
MKNERHDWHVRLGHAAAELSAAVTTPIVSHEEGGARQFAMGSFIQIGETKLLITAAHVLDEAEKNDWPLSVFDAVPDGEPATPVPLTGQSHRINEDAYDLAVIELGDTTIEKVPRRRFLTLQWFDIGTVRPGFYCAFGFPRSLEVPHIDGLGRYLGPFSYGGPLYGGCTLAFGGYDPLHHILTERSEVGVTGCDGNPGAMPEKLEGISGCPVFQAWRQDRPLSAWTPADIRVVGVLTGAHREAFIVTRWGRVVDLLWCAFPKLQPMLQLNGFTPGAVVGPAMSLK